MLQGKTALITGASRGIGQAIAFKLASHGVNLVLSSRSGGDLDRLSDQLKKEFAIKTKVIVADLLKPDAPEALIEKAAESVNGFDYLINNAGAALSQPISKTSLEQWNLMMNLNARAPFFLSQYALSYLKDSEDPVIINISSVVGRKGYKHQAAYTASKHALNGFTKVLAKEFKEFNIRVHLINPGGVDTDLVNEMRPDLDRNELIDPEEIADLVLFLLEYGGKAAIDEVNVRRSSSEPFS